MDLPKSQRRTASLIGVAALLMVASLCAYDYYSNWPWRYQGGILYERIVHDYTRDSLVSSTLYIGTTLLVLLCQAFGYELVVGESTSPSRRMLGNGLFVVATIAAAVIALLSGGGWLVVYAMSIHGG